MMEKFEVLENLFDKKILKILKFFLGHDSGRFYLREISRKADVSASSTYRILNKLVDMDILEMEEIKTAKLYNLSENKTVDFLKSMIEVDVLNYFVEHASKFEGVERIMQLGKKGKDKANLLVLGEGIDNSKMKLLCADIKEKYDFTVNQMTLHKDQYQQMSSMGLYPGKKKVLYSG